MNTNRQILHFIDGEYVEGSSGKTFDDINPATGKVIGTVYEASRDDVDRAVQAAKKALKGEWSKMPVFQRAALLQKVADGIHKRMDDFVAAELADTSKLKGPTAMGELPRAAEQFRQFAQMVINAPADSQIMPTPDGGQAINYGQRVPKGVVAAICPWNFPLMMLTWKVAPALAYGNTVVVKPSEETPATAALLGEVMNDAGIPKGVYNVVHGFGPDSAGEYLTQHPDVDAITFTGENGTGEAIMQQAALGLRDVSLEMGGKNPGIYFANCNMEAALQGTMASVFANSGQVCLCTERLYVERPIYEQFVEKLSGMAKGMKLGDPESPETKMGPSISKQQQQKILGYYEKAKKDGEILAGGGVPDMGDEWAGGSWIEPTVITGLKEDHDVVKQEIFGPVCHITPFDDEEEAVAMANDTEFGLAATVWSESVGQANRVASQANAGTVWVNTWAMRDLRAPFGGFGKSGIGRVGGRYGEEFYTELKNICARM